MTTPFKENYACGVVVKAVHGHTEIEHGGGIEGLNPELFYYPDDKLTIVVLGNLNGGAPGEIATQLAAVVHGEKLVLPSERKEIAVSPNIPAAYVGAYELASAFSIVITAESGRLMEQATNQLSSPRFLSRKQNFS